MLQTNLITMQSARRGECNTPRGIACRCCSFFESELVDNIAHYQPEISNAGHS
jgi:hypothetical protein